MLIHSFTEYSILLDWDKILIVVVFFKGTAVSSLEYTKLENALEMIEVKIVKACTWQIKQEITGKAKGLQDKE